MDRNNLYPVFLKVRNLKVLIVGGGFVAEEKLTFLLKSSPDAVVTIVAPFFREGTLEVAKKGQVTLLDDIFQDHYLNDVHIVVATTDKPEINEGIYNKCRALNKLVNVADNPP